MKNSLVINPILIDKIPRILEDIGNASPIAYVFFSLVYYCGIKQDDLFYSSIEDILNCNFPKYPDVTKLEPAVTSILRVSMLDPESRLKEHLPSRDYLYKLLKKYSKINELDAPISVSILQKTWAYNRLREALPVEQVMSHFSYKQGIYPFLTSFLGLSFNDCKDYPYLEHLYIKAMLHELSSKNYSSLTSKERDLIANTLLRITDIF